jgi:glycosyltransferase involved in cell wall biosynthesis
MIDKLSAKKIKVLHVRSTIGMYGAEQVLLNVLPVLNNYCEASLLTLETVLGDSATLRALLSDLGVDTHGYIPKGRVDRQVIKSIEEQIKTAEFNVIHTHDYKSLFYVYSTLKTLNIPIVHHIHGSLGNTISEKVYAVIEKLMMRKVSRVLTVSQEQKKSIETDLFTYPEIKQVNNGTVVSSMPESNKPNLDILNLIMVARFTEEKNHLFAIDMVEKLKNLNVPVILNLLGSGPLMAVIEEIINARNLKDCINLVGFTRDVAAWLDRSDVLLITSTTEGMPLNMLEGMERGLPIISTEVGEIPAIIKDANCGETYETLDELVQLVMKINTNRSEWKILGGLGRLYVKENLSIKSQVELLHSEYTGLV